MLFKVYSHHHIFHPYTILSNFVLVFSIVYCIFSSYKCIIFSITLYWVLHCIGYCIVLGNVWFGHCIVLGIVWFGYCIVMGNVWFGHCIVLGIVWFGYCIVMGIVLN